MEPGVYIPNPVRVEQASPGQPAPTSGRSTIRAPRHSPLQNVRLSIVPTSKRPVWTRTVGLLRYVCNSIRIAQNFTAKIGVSEFLTFTKN